MIKRLAKIQVRPDYVDEVYQKLLDAITDGTLAPGTRLTQEEIADEMEVSRSPVLQALRLLKKDGLVQDAPGRGVLVTPLDPCWIGDLYAVRGALDALAARLAAERRYQIAPALIAEGRRASAGKDVRAMIDADVAFHRAIYEAAQNPLIAQSTQVHWVHLRRAMGAVLQSSAQRASIWDEHEAIANAIASGEGARAAALSEQHTTQARENLTRRLGEILQARPQLA
ncbi:GntR family transcriptional regulator [Thauera humireducens]|uniref:GntR family transcriptional regulator n=1 Tax=Thauera humireducens TaxID=1134435 RepID=A0A127KA84_9RHOO|nr:GntR family transcriptional regulator [Thauera humireducens]AMO38801.1 GntR family transcriptional regulator [Thauera humireducens]